MPKNLPSYETQQEIKTAVNGIKTTTDSTQISVNQIKQNVENVSTQIANKNTSKVLKSKTYTSNATFTVPAGITEVYITGGGGGGGNGDTVVSKNGSSGGATSFGSLLTLSGGAGGIGGNFDPGTGVGGAAGGPGGQNGESDGYVNGQSRSWYGKGGDSGPYFGGITAPYPKYVVAARNGGYCSGGAGGAQGHGFWYAGGGGGGDFVYDRPVSVTPLSNISITIGTGGAAGGPHSGTGGNGILTVKWWE
ncbi:hypothetical protein [Lysinibacillus parviboronicapiens]|uniref:hypothetical protein n=1 Tax=Lysinibacillus parviboronicapiens TaxID=436516 RepID=UPI000D38592D|nr:hypothetical protein [Lysinibacillus parviboronicapiens]